MSPINKSLFNSLKKKYGIIKSKKIYMSMESENKPSFKKGLKTAKKEKHILNKFPKRKKKKKIKK